MLMFVKSINRKFVWCSIFECWIYNNSKKLNHWIIQWFYNWFVFHSIAIVFKIECNLIVQHKIGWQLLFYEHKIPFCLLSLQLQHQSTFLFFLLLPFCYYFTTLLFVVSQRIMWKFDRHSNDTHTYVRRNPKISVN